MVVKRKRLVYNVAGKAGVAQLVEHLIRNQ